MASTYGHLSSFFPLAPAFGCCPYLCSPYWQGASNLYQMGTGLNRSLFQAKTATSLQGSAVQTPKLCLSLGIKYLGNTSALRNCLNPSRKAVLGKRYQYSNRTERKGEEPGTALQGYTAESHSCRCGSPSDTPYPCLGTHPWETQRDKWLSKAPKPLQWPQRT